MGITTFILCLVAVSCVGILLAAIVMRKCIVMSLWAIYAVFSGFLFAIVGVVITALLWFVLFGDVGEESASIAFFVFSFLGAFIGSFFGSARDFEWVNTRTMRNTKWEGRHAD